MFEGVEEPGPAGEGAYVLRMAIPLNEDRINAGVLGVKVGIDLPLDLRPNRLEQGLGRVELRAVGWQRHQRQTNT